VSHQRGAAQVGLDLSLIYPGNRVLVALSGGADSLALLHLLCAQRAALGLWLAAVHVHHGMRGDEAEADVRFVTDVCAAWDVPLEVAAVDVPGLAVQQRIAVEEAGRLARYDAFAEAARKLRCEKVALAHHADDQAETVLLNLFRGAGIDGLAGIPPRRPLSAEAEAPEVIRPLLRVWRAQIDAYCAANGLEPRHDRTNDDLGFRRNRVRRQLLPHLADYDPNIRAHLVRLASQAREEADLLQAEAEDLLAAALRPGAGLRLDSAVLTAARPALARRALRLALRKLGGYAVEVDAALIARLWELCRGERRTALDLPGCAARARLEHGVLILEPSPAAAPRALTEAVEVVIPGITPAPALGVRMHARETEPPIQLRLPPHQAVLDLAALTPPLVLRTAREGERFQPLGGPGRRLLSDFFIDRKIPRERRSAWPILADAAGVVWIVGLAVAHRARVQAETTRCLALQAYFDPPDML